MILERLRELAHRVGDSIPPLGYDKMKIAWDIQLDEKGNLLEPVPTRGEGKRKYVERVAPNPNLTGKRASNVKAGLLADTAEYALGKAAASKGDRTDRVRDQHDAFVEVAKECSEALNLPQVNAVYEFVRRPDIGDDPRLKEIDGGDWVTFSVGGAFVTELPELRDYWLQKALSDMERSGTCMVCGESEVPLVRRHPVALKGVPGGQTAGVQLISANAEPFESYGLKESFIAPMCLCCADEVHKVINYLIDSDAHHFRLSDKLVYLFWTREPAGEFDVAKLFSEAAEDEVKKLYGAVYKGKDERVDVVEEDQFYALALSGSGGRAVVRDWIEASLPQTKLNLASYFAGQHITGGQHSYVNLFALAAATVRELKEVVPWVPLAIVQHALKGEALPLSLLTTTVRRCGIGKTYGENRRHADHAQAALIKLCLISWRAQGGQQTPEDWMVKLDLNCEEPAYLYGRLFSTLEQIQEGASGVNNVERTFGTAFMSPTSTLPRLIARAKQAHLPKLRRDMPGRGVNLEKQLNEVHGKLGTSHAFLKKLDPEGQGMFVLGYYHQNAARWEDIEEAKQRKAASGTEDQNSN